MWKTLFLVSTILLGCASAAVGQVGWMYPYVEAVTAESGAHSLAVNPDGGGRGFAEACTGVPSGRGDASIKLVLYDDMLPWGEVVPGYPAEDICLMTNAETFAACPGGTIADAPTDQNGETYWSAPPRAGGWFEPTDGGELFVWVSGWECTAPGLRELRFNSPDLTGDLVVNLADVGLFSHDFETAYAYRSDLAWDGTLNLADVSALALGVGASCP